MFPSCGYFKGINCPFFASGLCDRPYCHFRHSKVEEKTKDNGPSYSTSSNVTAKGYSSGPSSSTYNKSQLSFGHSEIASYSTAQGYHTTGPVEAYSTSEADPSETQSTCAIPTFTGQTQNLPASSEENETYQSLPRISGLPKSRTSSSTNGNLPSYKPTPKLRVQLTVKAGTPSYKPTPKNELGGTSKRSKVLEYDPVKNFAFQHGGDDEQRKRNGTHKHEEALFSDSDAVSDGGEWEAEAAEIDESINESVVEAETDVTNDDSTASTISSKHLPSYADLLTPSSYFTSKLPSNSSKKSEENRKESSSSESSRKSSLPRSHEAQTEKHHTSSASSSSSTSKHQLSNSSSSSLSSIKDSKKHSSTSSKGSNSEKKSLSRKHSSRSSDRDKKSSSASSELKDKHNHHGHSSDRKEHRHSEGERASSSTSEKENKKKGSDDTQSVASKRRSTSTDSSSSSSKHHRSSEVKNSSSSTTASSSKHHKSTESSTKSSSVSKLHKSLTSAPHKSFKKHESSSTKSTQPLNRKHSTENNEKTSISSEIEKRSDSACLSKVKTEGCSRHFSVNEKTLTSSQRKLSSDTEAASNHNKHKEKKFPKIESETVKLKKEGRESTENKPKRLSISERRISDITCNLFGEDSADSDSDVQIVEPPPAKPVEVYELTDSDDDSGGFTDDVDLLSDPNTFDECLKIFQESERKLAKQQKQAKDEEKKQTDIRKSVKKEEDPVPVGKKRMAHKGAEQVKRPLKAPGQQRPRLSPAEVMHNRIVEMQKRALLRAARREGRESELPKEVMSSSTSPRLSASSGSSSNSLSAAASSLLSQQRKREAHTPTKPVKTFSESQSAVWSPNSFYKKKAPTLTDGSQGSVEKKQVTPAETASKTEKRKAHTPTQINLQRPVLPAAFGAKVPTNIRQRYLNLIIDEYLKFNPEQVSIDKGLEEEEVVYGRASNKNIYLRLVVNAIKRIRTEAAESLPSSSKKPCTDSVKSQTLGSMAQSHAATLGGSRAAKTSFTLNRSGGGVRGPSVAITGAELYRRLTKFVLKEEELQEHGFPRPSEDGSSKAIFYKKESVDTLLKDNERVCRRCGKRFYVAKDGKPLVTEDCCYHYGNAYKKKVAGSIDSRYACCNDRAGSKGCTVAKSHVHERNKTENLSGYMKTMSSTSSEKNHKVFALDCEMIYTYAGLELARVTVVGENRKTEYEALVKPDTPVIDYNTRFSGITEADLEGVNTTLRGVQAVLLNMISDKTILIGHSLESDLTALKLLHGTVVDTSVVFPHRLGLPYKRALRNLTVEYLQKIIQADDGGHDSKEDAVACMELMIHKVKEEAKHEVRRN